MFTLKDVLTIGISAGIPILLWWLTLPKQKAEIGNYFTNMYKGLIDELSAALDTHKQEIAENKKRLQEQEAVNEMQQKENEECKYTSAALKLQVKRLNRIVDLNGYPWEKVYVLDDNVMVTKSFEHHFEEANIQMAVFNEPVSFLRDVKEHKPCVLIIDNWLGDMEAEEVIRQINYKPEILLMSQDYTLAAKYKDLGIRFFPKSENYVFKIAQAVIQYLSEKK